MITSAARHPRHRAGYGIARKPEGGRVRMIRLAPTPVLQAIDMALVERFGKDSSKARFYLKYAEAWYPKTWTKEQFEEELARPSTVWSPRMQQAFASEYCGRMPN